MSELTRASYEGTQSVDLCEEHLEGFKVRLGCLKEGTPMKLTEGQMATADPAKVTESLQTHFKEKKIPLDGIAFGPSPEGVVCAICKA